ncbi:MAG: hypothetical protein KH452_06290 [Clostridiales bacterium]|nr:hypothetical protein [Clostridiales bacterium]
MKNKKIIGLLLSLVLILGMTMPGTLATSTDITNTDSEFSISTVESDGENSEVPLEDTENKTDEIPAAEDDAAADSSTCTCGTEDGIHTEDCALYVAPAEPTCTCGTEDGTHTEDCALYVAPAEPTCTCGTEDGTHTEDCALYVAPAEPTCTCGTEDGTHTEDCALYAAPVEPTCTCGTEDGTHTEDCALYAAPVEPALPEEPAHIDTCSEDCTGDGCDCSCHELSLFERIMNCETLEELFDIADAAPEEELLALTDEENAEIEAKIAALEPEPLPPVVLEDCVNESVISEIIYPAVNFDNVAPFGAPVEG